jgi:peroxisomal coenzyme A diphosphatase NUDT7
MKQLDLDKLENVLPSMPGILRKEEYFNSAVLIPIVKINNEYQLLFEKRAAGIRQGGEICFPGGEFDPEMDTNFRDTAIRETMEELGIQKDKINVIGALDVLIGPMGVTIDPFVAEVKIDSLTDLIIDSHEVDKAFTVPLSFFTDNEPEVYYVRMEIQPAYLDKEGLKIDLFPTKELNLPERYHTPWNSGNQRVLVYKVNGEIIWGLTAILIEEIIRKIKLL